MDYVKIALWWTERGLPAVPKSLLRPAHGVIVETHEVDTVAGWIYFDETHKIGLVDWVTTNPAMAVSAALGASVQYLLEFFQDYSIKRGCHDMFSFVAKDTGLHRLCVKHGWQDPKSCPHIMIYKSF